MTEQTDVLEFAKAMADCTRQSILRFVCCRWRTVSEIVQQMDLTQPTVSHHLALLKEQGLVDVRHAGKQSYYRLNQEHFSACCGELMKRFASEEQEASEPCSVKPGKKKEKE